ELACFLIITSYLLLLSSSLINADPVLIALTCERSWHSDYCHMSLNSSKEATSQQDIRGLAGTPIDCAFRQLNATHETLANCYSTKEGDESSRCRRCTDQFDSAIQHVKEFHLHF
ncbi:hypothetical protein LINGRAPRIM_LOCUS1275, partial [Linum grandiflorum]